MLSLLFPFSPSLFKVCIDQAGNGIGGLAQHIVADLEQFELSCDCDPALVRRQDCDRDGTVLNDTHGGEKPSRIPARAPEIAETEHFGWYCRRFPLRAADILSYLDLDCPAPKRRRQGEKLNGPAGLASCSCHRESHSCHLPKSRLSFVQVTAVICESHSCRLRKSQLSKGKS